jgi:solute:Na+ symporter, SSS family
MQLHVLDIAIILACLLGTVVAGYWVSHHASRDISAYFLAGNRMPWYVLGISNASGMFDISGTMLLVYWMFVYGLKSVWIPWLWPTFNQIFLMVYLSAWLRRSNVMTGAEWITTRFGTGRGARLSHMIVVIYAFVGIIGFFSYGFKGMGKFAAAFLPWHLTPNEYALILVACAAAYVIKGGMISTVITDVVQFCILSCGSFAVGVIAMRKVAPALLHRVTPGGWDNVFFGWRLGLDWSGLIPAANARIAQDGYGLFGFFVMMLLCKGLLVSAAGPVPNYDLQRVLSARNAREASMMSGWVNIVLSFPRYFLVAGLTVLTAAFLDDNLRTAGSGMDFELVLPYALQRFVPAGLLGLLIAGLLSAFMSNFAGTVNAAPPYFVSDIYKRYIRPDAPPRTYVRLSYISSIVVVVAGVLIGWNTTSVNSVVLWIVSGLWVGYTASNVLKWYWWRFNGYGYFWGMVAGISAALVLPLTIQRITTIQNILSRLSLNYSVTVVFPLVLLVSLAGCLAGTFLNKPEDMQVLKSFYRKVRPWGFWGPVAEQVRADDASIQTNHDFLRDIFNVGIGMVWQVALVALPMFVVIREFKRAAITCAVVAATSTILKFTWYDHLAVREAELELSSRSGDATVVPDDSPACYNKM